MNLTKRQEKQLVKCFDDPKKLRKWVDDVYNQMVRECQKQTNELIDEYINIYSITVAFTAHYVLGLGKKRLPEFMDRVWNNLDAFRTGHLTLDDCIGELEEYNIDFEKIIRNPERKRKDDC